MCLCACSDTDVIGLAILCEKLLGEGLSTDDAVYRELVGLKLDRLHLGVILDFFLRVNDLGLLLFFLIEVNGVDLGLLLDLDSFLVFDLDIYVALGLHFLPLEDKADVIELGKSESGVLIIFVLKFFQGFFVITLVGLGITFLCDLFDLKFHAHGKLCGSVEIRIYNVIFSFIGELGCLCDQGRSFFCGSCGCSVRDHALCCVSSRRCHSVSCFFGRCLCGRCRCFFSNCLFTALSRAAAALGSFCHFFFRNCFLGGICVSHIFGHFRLFLFRALKHSACGVRLVLTGDFDARLCGGGVYIQCDSRQDQRIGRHEDNDCRQD